MFYRIVALKFFHKSSKYVRQILVVLVKKEIGYNFCKFFSESLSLQASFLDSDCFYYYILLRISNAHVEPYQIHY